MASEVHLGDIGTRYKARIKDAGAAFDPSDATTKQIIFKMPQGVLVKTATALQEGDDWFLVYDVTESTFHSAVGKVSLQAFLEFPDGTEYHSDIQTLDEDGNELRVHKNIEIE